MSKFHEEFFRQKGTVHDKLVLKCITPEGKKKILETVNFCKRAYASLETPEKVWGCDSKKTKWCLSPKYWREKPKCAWDYNKHYPRGEFCSSFDKENFEKTDSEREYESYRPQILPGKVAELIPEGQWEKVEPSMSSNDLEVKHSVEVICRNNNFIVGYADILFKVNAIVKVSLKIISTGEIWEDFQTKEYEERIVVDAKPELTDFGAVLRQIKTYMDILRVKRGVIVTYSNPSVELVELLKNERVYVVKFPGKSELKLRKALKNVPSRAGVI